MDNGPVWKPVSRLSISRRSASAGKQLPWSLRLISSLLASIALLLAMSGISAWNLRAQRIEGEWVAHSNQVRYQLVRILQLLIDAQTGAREFALGSDRALRAYRDATPLIAPSIEHLKQLTADNPQQRPLAAQLDVMARDIEACNATLLAEARNGNNAQVQSLINQGHIDDVMASARTLLAQMQAEEDRLVVERRITRDRARRDAALALWATGGLGALLLVLIVYFTRRDEATLHRAEHELATTLRSIGDAVISTDVTGTIRFMNPVAEALTGWDETSARGLPLAQVFKIIGEDSRAPVDSPARVVLQEGKTVRLANHTLLIARDGTERSIADSGAPIVAETGDVQGMVLVFRDVSEDRRAERTLQLRDAELQRSQAALQETDRRKDEFIATLSHELRNPLAPIRAAAKIIASPQVATEQLQRAQIIIERQVTHMALLLDDLLDIARITQGKLNLKKEPVALFDVVDAAVEAARPMLNGKNHQLSLSLPTEPVLLDADPVRISQILSNLLTNAAKYSDPGSHIEVVGSVENDTLSLSVKDDGIGIAPESITGIFEMFSQIEGVAGRSEGGLGIGLALVKGLTELHGGTVEARSAGLGSGSEFVVRLPVSQGRLAPLLAADPAPQSARRRILIADDNTDAAESLSMLLVLAGHDVRVAHLGRDAISIAQTFRPDIALLDIGMPDLSGYEVARELRQEPGAERIRLIALTGWGQEEDRRQALQAGFDHHLVKPVNPDELETLIASQSSS